MNILDWLFGKKKDFENFEDELQHEDEFEESVAASHFDDEDETPYLGLNLDPRSEEEKAKEDLKFEETVAKSSVADVKWQEKDIDDLRQFPVQDQNGSGSCVAQTLKKLLGILFWLRFGEYIKFSASHIYQRRSNKPSAGMHGANAYQIAGKGVTLDIFAPSEQMTDAEMDAVEVEKYAELIGEQFRLPKAVELPARDIDTVASVIQETKKAVMVWFYFTSSEWKANPNKKDNYTVPEVKTPSLTIQSGARHSVAAVDFFMYKGKKALLIEDSAHFGGLSRRIVTEDFFKARNYYAAYPINFYFLEEQQGGSEQPRHHFDRELEWSPVFKTDPEVVWLQKCLQHDGSFPDNIECTGYYGNITAEAVLKFQRKWKVAATSELDALQGRRVGGKTLLKLNAIYSS